MKCNLCGADLPENGGNCPGCNVLADFSRMKVLVPEPRGAVNDYPALLTDAQAGELASMVGAFFRQTDVPIVIAIVNTAEPLQPSEYAFLLYNHWGIGKKGVNKGVLLLLCLKERHLESEIGLGLENILPEDVGDEIVMDEFLPHFREGNFFEGLKAGVKGIIDYLLEKLPTIN
ncbi:MAG: TPM domain-containing protein [bacterium]